MMPRYVEKRRTVEAVQFNNGIIMPEWMKDAVNAGIIYMRPDEEHDMVAVVHYPKSDMEQIAVFGDYLVYDEFTKDIRVEPKDAFEYHYELEMQFNITTTNVVPGYTTTVVKADYKDNSVITLT